MASIVARFAAFCIFLSVVFAILTYNYKDFQWPVLMIFFFVLGVSHVFLASNSFKPRHIRIMDFGYVLSGCLAAYIGLQEVKNQKFRDPYLFFLGEKKLAYEERQLPMKAQPRSIADYIKKEHERFCAGPFLKEVYYEEPLCKWADTTSDQLNKNPRPVDIASLYETSKSTAERKSWDFIEICSIKKKEKDGTTTYSLQTDPALLQLCFRNSFVSNVIEGLRISVRRNEAAQPRKYEDSNEGKLTLFGAFKALLWPIALAVALAFRTTKATADVTGLASSG